MLFALLALPVAVAPAVAPAVPTPAPAAVSASAGPARTGDYVVRPGDTVSEIAVRRGVPQREIMRLNSLDAQGRIRAGDRLRLPGPSSSPASPAGAPARAGSSSLATLSPQRADVARRIVREAQARGVDPALALAVGWQESRFRPNARSHANAIGAMQCLPSTARWMSSKVGRPLNPHDTGDNVTCGVAYLQHLSRRTGHEPTAIAAYYQGLTSVREKGLYPSTQSYVASVQRHRARFAAGLPGVG